MTLVIDIGNTNIVCGVYKTDVLVWHARFKTDKHRTADEYFSLLSSLRNNNWTIEDINCIAIASVVPELSRIWQHLSSKYFKLEAIVIDGYSKLGISYSVSDPGFIGADLVVNAFAAWKKYHTSCIIIDLGTATTIQLISSSGDFIGTVIAPGIRTGAAELFEKAALLSAIELSAPTVTLGTNTRDAMLSGIVIGHALMIESFIKRIIAEYKELQPITTIATGGIADLIIPQVQSIDIMNKTLTLEGLYMAANLLKKESLG